MYSLIIRASNAILSAPILKLYPPIVSSPAFLALVLLGTVYILYCYRNKETKIAETNMSMHAKSGALCSIPRTLSPQRFILFFGFYIKVAFILI